MIVSAAQHQHRLWWFWDSFETKKLHEPQHKTFSLDFCCTINVAFHASNFSKRSLTRISGLFDLVKIVFQGLRLTRCWKLRLYREMFPRLIGPPAACSLPNVSSKLKRYRSDCFNYIIIASSKAKGEIKGLQRLLSLCITFINHDSSWICKKIVLLKFLWIKQREVENELLSLCVAFINHHRSWVCKK